MHPIVQCSLWALVIQSTACTCPLGSYHITANFCSPKVSWLKPIFVIQYIVSFHDFGTAKPCTQSAVRKLLWQNFRDFCVIHENHKYLTMKIWLSWWTFCMIDRHFIIIWNVSIYVNIEELGMSILECITEID